MILTLAGFSGLGWVVWSTTPQAAQSVIWFYLAAGAATLGLTAWLGFLARQRFGQREFTTFHLKVSLRQGLWLTILVSACLFLLSKDLFTWTNTLLLVFALTCLELFFLYSESKN